MPKGVREFNLGMPRLLLSPRPGQHRSKDGTQILHAPFRFRTHRHLVQRHLARYGLLRAVLPPARRAQKRRLVLVPIGPRKPTCPRHLRGSRLEIQEGQHPLARALARQRCRKELPPSRRLLPQQSLRLQPQSLRLHPPRVDPKNRVRHQHRRRRRRPSQRRHGHRSRRLHGHPSRRRHLRLSQSRFLPPRQRPHGLRRRRHHRQSRRPQIMVDEQRR